MILVDTSVWVDHLRTGDAGLVRVLEQGLVVGHPFVLGELSLGHLRHRERVFGALADLPQIPVATDKEVLHLIEEGPLFGRGIGYVDAHLLASLRLSPGSRLWTRDRQLRAVAERFGLASAH